MFASTADSPRSLLYRVNSPVERNWSWSPRAPGTHRLIQSLNLDNPRHRDTPIAPYETFEPARPLVFPDVDPTESKIRCAAEFEAQRPQHQAELKQIIPEPVRALKRFGFEGEIKESAAIL
jgi:hypothetical protein